MQEVLAKIYRSLQQTPDREMSKAYVRQIATHTWIERCRSRQAKISVVAFDELMHQPKAAPVSEISVREMFEQLADRLNVRQMVLDEYIAKWPMRRGDVFLRSEANMSQHAAPEATVWHCKPA